MTSRKIQQRRESNQAILAQVKREMNEPRMSASAREEETNPDHAAGVGILSMRGWMLQMEEDNGKANHGNS